MNTSAPITPITVRRGRKMPLMDEEYVTVAQAAELLKVSRSTLWRWIDQGHLPAYRFGLRRVLIRRTDLERLISPARGEKGGSTWQQERERLSRPLTQQERQAALAALDEAKRLKAKLLERRGGQPFADSVALIRTMRDERTRERS
jgi:excisionase family DNA binding protein